MNVDFLVGFIEGVCVSALVVKIAMALDSDTVDGELKQLLTDFGDGATFCKYLKTHRRALETVIASTEKRNKKKWKEEDERKDKERAKAMAKLSTRVYIDPAIYGPSQVSRYSFY